MTLLQVWAPHARSVACPGRRLGGAARGGRRRVVARRRTGRGARRPTTPSCSTTTARRCPTRARAGSRTACTARRRRLRPRPVRLDRRGVARRGAAGVGRSTSCTSAPSPRRARSTPPSSASTTWSTLGVDLVELMPVAAFPGAHGWGYDGVHPYAVHEPYGGPDALKRFVDACHAARPRGLPRRRLQPPRAVAGTTCRGSGPYFTDKHHTPWGAGGQPRRRGLPTRCAAGSSTTR